MLIDPDAMPGLELLMPRLLSEVIPVKPFCRSVLNLIIQLSVSWYPIPADITPLSNQFR